MKFKFESITCCLDMYGCPNRCKHCWLGSTPNGNLDVSELYWLKNEFEKFAQNIVIYDWYREPDYKDNYRELWEISKVLSSDHIKYEHYELISFWRLVRDNKYVKWLNEINLKTAQLTIFGGEETTDYFLGRKGSYKEILQAIEILIENKISPRIHIIVNKRNIQELEHIANLIEELDLVDRCEAFGGEFSLFMHQGSCDGENAQFYDDWITSSDLKKLPNSLVEFTLNYFGKNNIQEVFGSTERELCNELITEETTASFVDENPVFFVDKDFNVYPNTSTPAEHWCLGNIKTEGAEQILKNYLNNASKGQSTRINTAISELVKKAGNFDSERLFYKDDYIIYLVNQCCKI